MKLYARLLAILLAVSLLAGSLCLGVYAAKGQEMQTKDDSEENEEYVEPVPEGLRLLWVEENRVKLTWEYSGWLDEDMGFEVLRYDAAQKKYVHVKYIKNYETILTDLEAGAAYTVRVRTYTKIDGKKVFGPRSEAFRFSTSIKAVKISDLKYVSTGKIQVSWKQNSKASGYLIEYSPKSTFPTRQTNRILAAKDRSSYSIKGLGKLTYYVRVTPYKMVNGVRYCGTPSEVRSVVVKKGATLKEKINAVTTDLTGRDAILELTENGVDIKKYSTTYSRLREIYRWHAVHAKEFDSCLACNTNFNCCVDALYAEKRKYDNFIWIEADSFRNNDGSVVMHKWSVLYFAGTPYIFDPRMQGNVRDYNGTTYFGIYRYSTAAKPFIHDYWMWYWRDLDVYGDVVGHK